MQYKFAKKIFSVVLSASLIFQLSMPAVYAEEKTSIEDTKSVTIFSELRQALTTGSAITIDFNQPVAAQLSSLTAGDIVIIDGGEVTYKGDVSSTGLNIPYADYVTDGKKAIYKAGEGYILITWPTEGGGPYIVTLHDVNIDIAGTGEIDAINIFGKVIMTLEGNNILKAPRNAINISNSSPELTLGGNGYLRIESSVYGIKAYNGNVTIQDGVKLSLIGAKFGINVGSYDNVTIKDNTEVNISVKPGDTNNYAILCGRLYVKGNSKVDTNGEHTFLFTREDIELDSTATLNTIRRGLLTSSEWPHRVYGTVTIPENITVDFLRKGPLTAQEDAHLINNGKIIFNEYISLQELKGLNITNNGTLLLKDKAVQLFGDTLYADKGDLTGDIDFKTNMPTEPTYYKNFDGYLLFKPKSGTENAVVTLHGTNLKANNNLLILPDEQVDIVLEGENDADIIRVSKSFNLKCDGTLNASRIEATDDTVQMNMDSGVKLNAEYRAGSNMVMTSIFYGKNKVAYSEGIVVRSDQRVILKTGSELELLGQGFLQLEEGALSDLVIEQGASIINNAHIFLPIGTAVEQIKAFNFKGSGAVRVVKEYDNGKPSSWDTYTNAGKPVVEIKEDLTLRDTEVTEADKKGYTWTKDVKEGLEIWTLTLKNVLFTGSIDLPNKEVIINTLENSDINGSITTSTGYPINPVFTGCGALTINGGINGATNNDTVTVKDGAKLNLIGNISIGGSGGSGGAINVIGSGTILDITSDMATAVYTGTVNIKDGAILNAKTTGEGSKGIFALSGVNIAGGSTLNVGCDYGVYIIGGKLTMDESSKLITNASAAPFCIVDTTGSKPQSEVLSLAGIPTGTKIASVTGTHDFNGTKYNYWSITSENGSLSVADENSEPVTLIGAAVGKLSFVKPASNNNKDTSDGGDSSTNSDKTDTSTEQETYSILFTDIDTHWAKDDITFVTQRGLFGGTEKDKFSPDMPMTRGMFVTVLGRLAKLDVSSYTQSHFADVRAGSYYLPYIEWAYKNNIVRGMSSDSFEPDKLITREQMAVIMVNYSKMTGFELPQLQSEINFEDESEISSFAKSSVKQMQMASIILGKQANRFDPKGTATRAEVSAVLKRYVEIAEKK